MVLFLTTYFLYLLAKNKTKKLDHFTLKQLTSTNLKVTDYSTNLSNPEKKDENNQLI